MATSFQKSKLYPHLHITCDISANDFNHHFANISNKMNSTFPNFDDKFSGKARKVFMVFVSRRWLMEILKHIWDLNLINPIMIYWVWTLFSWENQPHIYSSLANVIYKPLKSGVFEQDWMNTRVTPIYKNGGDINDENTYRPISIIGQIAKMIESHVSYQVIDFLEEHGFIFQWIHLLIWKGIPPKLAFIVL